MQIADLNLAIQKIDDEMNVLSSLSYLTKPNMIRLVCLTKKRERLRKYKDVYKHVTSPVGTNVHPILMTVITHRMLNRVRFGYKKGPTDRGIFINIRGQIRYKLFCKMKTLGILFPESKLFLSEEENFKIKEAIKLLEEVVDRRNFNLESVNLYKQYEDDRSKQN